MINIFSGLVGKKKGGQQKRYSTFNVIIFRLSRFWGSGLCSIFCSFTILSQTRISRFLIPCLQFANYLGLLYLSLFFPPCPLPWSVSAILQGFFGFLSSFRQVIGHSVSAVFHSAPRAPECHLSPSVSTGSFRYVRCIPHLRAPMVIQDWDPPGSSQDLCWALTTTRQYSPPSLWASKPLTSQGASSSSKMSWDEPEWAEGSREPRPQLRFPWGPGHRCARRPDTSLPAPAALWLPKQGSHATQATPRQSQVGANPGLPQLL